MSSFNAHPREISTFIKPRGVVSKRRVRHHQLALSKTYNARRGSVSGGYQAFDEEFYRNRESLDNSLATLTLIEKEYKEGLKNDRTN